MAGFLEAAETHGWSVRQSIAAVAGPSGLVTTEAFETVVGEILKATCQQPHPDAVLSFLHGAMVAESALDGERALRERAELRTVALRGPIIDSCNDGRTQGGPRVPLLARARELEQEAGIWTVSINAGFPDCDIPETGFSVTRSGTAPLAELRAAGDLPGRLAGPKCQHADQRSAVRRSSLSRWRESVRR